MPDLFNWKRFKNLFVPGNKFPEPDPEPGTDDLERREASKWSIGIYKGTSPLDLHPPGTIDNPVLTAAHVTDVKANFVADPFMIKHESTWYMFFEVEVQEKSGNIGKIGLAQSSDCVTWKYRKIVLEEPWHLSYPYVFKWEDDFFMIPETRSNRSIRLYRALDFPYKWKLEKTLLKKRRFSDSTIFQYNDKWWIFTDSGNTTLRLYYSDTLTGSWKEHFQSPLIKKNPQIARPGGRVVFSENLPIRYTQDCTPYYGTLVWAFKITELTPKTYMEEKYPCPIIAASGKGWNCFGMHTIDPHKLNENEWIACVDGFGEQD